MKCANCKGENRPQAGFCAWCGAKLQPSAGGQPLLEAFQPEEQVRSDSSAPAGGAAEPIAPLPQTAPAAAPLQPGVVLAARYRILELLSSSPVRNRYKVLDLAYCRVCGNETNQDIDQYCRNCGAMLDPRRTVTLEEQMRVLPPAEYDIHLTIDQREYYGVVEQEAIPTGSSSEAGAGAHLRWGLATDQGKQRDHNEDYLEGWICSRGNRPLLALFIVADGLGGQDSGEIASRMTVDIVWQQVKTALWDRIIADDIPEQTQFPAALRAAVTAANTEVHRARLERSSQMSSTVTAALVYGGSAYIANVGDSRTYIFGQHGLQRITKDHSLVQRLVDTGQIKPEDVYSHPRRNLIYQSIGDRQDVVVDLYTYELKPDERLILCSDGLWEMVHDDGLEEVLLAEADPQQACDRLVKNANMAGGEDNISVIVALV